MSDGNHLPSGLPYARLPTVARAIQLGSRVPGRIGAANHLISYVPCRKEPRHDLCRPRWWRPAVKLPANRVTTQTIK